MLYLTIIISLFLIINAQKPARIGPDGKPLLNRPIPEECKKRISHMQWGGHNYFLSWREPWHKFEDWDWFNGRNFCRDRCMDLISFDSPGEYQLFAKIVQQDNVSSIYTSGRKCNFKGKGCDADHLQPINENGWFWAGAENKRIPSTNQPHPDAYWSQYGEKSKGQPDNFEGLKNGPLETEFDVGITIEGLQEYHDEACLAVLNNKYKDGVTWHDVACHFRSVIVCEDSKQLLELVENQDGEDLSNTVVKIDDDRQVNVESVLANVNDPIKPAPQPQPQPQPLPQQVHPRPQIQKKPNLFGHGGPTRPRPVRKPTSFLGALGLNPAKFPFFF